MKKGALFLAAFLAFISFAAGQEIFDLIRKGDISAVRALIEKSPDVLRAKLANGSTPLHLAATAGMKEMSALLLEKGAALEARDDYGRTPLVVCARERGQVETGKLLIDAGADVNAADKFGSTALELAAWRGKADFVGLLLAKGAKIPTEGRKLSLFLSMSASQGLTALFDRIISAGGDLKAAAAANPGLLSPRPRAAQPRSSPRFSISAWTRLGGTVSAGLLSTTPPGMEGRRRSGPSSVGRSRSTRGRSWVRLPTTWP